MEATVRNNDINSIMELLADKIDAGAMNELELIRRDISLIFNDRPLLNIACDLNLPRAVAILIAAGADVNAQNEDGYSPLHYACAGGHVLPVQLLLEAGADPSIKDKNGFLPIDLASNKEIKDIIDGLGGGRATKAAIS